MTIVFFSSCLSVSLCLYTVLCNIVLNEVVFIFSYWHSHAICNEWLGGGGVGGGGGGGAGGGGGGGGGGVGITHFTFGSCTEYIKKCDMRQIFGTVWQLYFFLLAPLFVSIYILYCTLSSMRLCLFLASSTAKQFCNQSPALLPP
jgi:hypothetical protein